MEQKMFENEDGKVFYKEYYLNDLIENIESEGMSKEQIKEICAEFFKMMTRDLILENDCFIFPEWGLGYLYIRDIAKISHPDAPNPVLENEEVYQPVMSISNGKLSWYAWNVRFLGSTQELFQKEIDNNHHY